MGEKGVPFASLWERLLVKLFPKASALAEKLCWAKFHQKVLTGLWCYF